MHSLQNSACLLLKYLLLYRHIYIVISRSFDTVLISVLSFPLIRIVHKFIIINSIFYHINISVFLNNNLFPLFGAFDLSSK